MGFLEFLAKKEAISAEDFAHLEDVARTQGVGIEQLLIKQGVVSGDMLLQFKGEYFNLPIRSSADVQVPAEIQKQIPQESSLHYKFAAVGMKDGVLEVGVVDPDNIDAMDAIQFISSKIGVPFKVFLVSEEDFTNIINGRGGITGEVSSALSELQQDFNVDDLPKEGAEAEDIDAMKATSAAEKGKTIIEDAPVTKMVAVILRHATEGNASDIHIENMGEKIRVRFRVDGTLHTSLLLPANVHSAIVSRIKILASLKLDEKRKPQDGRFSARIDKRKIDFRVSTLPAYYGEKVVMRILDSEKGVLSLASLGMGEKDLGAVREAIARPYGMILLTGPTGSGKSTTLYAMLNELDRDSDNVVSLEDPVEYSMPGVNQSQVRPEIDYTFASGLRSILRQDPDIIMVGEIRDKETAQLAVQAALTGHLVFSTLHTNTATGVIPRLIDMGVDPYLIAPTLLLAIGQRLVTKLCPGAGKSIPLSDSLRMLIEKDLADLSEVHKKNIPIPDAVYEATPTSDCPSGTRGRLAVFELLKIDQDLQQIILKNPTEPDVYKVARSKGMLTMKEDAMLKAFNGLIPFVEVNKL
ncbi:MAG: type II/IV secretion system protein [Parcubacteria group bacterium]|nr:type II/IV secretion system protein [Parcubacteria group bacterium]